jgi:predicted MFS family arabinose efflux permease
MQTALGSHSEFRDNWRLLLATTLGSSFGMPTLAYFSIGVFAPILAKEFGWSFASIMGGLFLTAAVILVCGPIIGMVIDRYGSRKVIAVSLVGLSFSYMSLAISNGSIFQYYASWAGMAVTGIGATAISFTHAVNRAFVVRRGTALGITLAGSGIFALWVKPFANWSIDLFGWRATILVIGALPLLIGVPVVLWGLRDRGDAKRLNARDGRPDAPASGLTLKDAIAKPAFWLVLLAFIPISFANGAPLPNMENILRTLQLSTAEVVQVTSLIGVSLVVGRLVGGWLVDRIWAPLVGLILLIGGALGCWMLSQPSVTYREALGAVMLLSFAAGVEYDLLAYLIARYMGMRSYGAIYSIVFGLFAIGAGAGPSVLGHVFDSSGSYARGLLVCGGLLLFAGLVLLTLGRYPRFADAPEES